MFCLSGSFLSGRMRTGEDISRSRSQDPVITGSRTPIPLHLENPSYPTCGDMSFRNQTPSGRRHARHAAPPNSPPVTRPPQERRLLKRNEGAMKADLPKATARVSSFSAEALSGKSAPFVYPGLEYRDLTLDGAIVPLTQKALKEHTNSYIGTKSPKAVWAGHYRPLSYAPRGSSNSLSNMPTKQGTLLTSQASEAHYLTGMSTQMGGSTLQGGEDSWFPDVQSRSGSTSHFDGISPPKHPGYYTRTRTLRGQPEQPERIKGRNSTRTRKDSGVSGATTYGGEDERTLRQPSSYGRG